MAESIGRRIARLRLEHGMTQERLAGLMNVSPQAVSKWENDISYPDITLLAPLSAALDVSIDELLGATASAEPEPEPVAEPEPVVEPTMEVLLPEGDALDRAPSKLHIHITDDTGDVVNINLPLGIVRAGIGIAGNIPGVNGEMLKGIDLDVLLQAASGGCGTLIDATDGHDHVRITLE